MKCNKKLLEAYLNDELINDKKSQELISTSDRDILRDHLTYCPHCQKEYENLRYLNSIFDSYQNHEIDENLLYSLQQIQYHTKKKFGLFHLLPREFALTVASVVIALFTGIIFSAQIISVETDDTFYSFEFFEEISLISLIDY